MANKNKKKRRRPPPAGQASAPAPSTASGKPTTDRTPPRTAGGATPVRRERKDQARRAREAERRRRSRQAAIRRFVTIAVILAIGLGAFYFLTKAASPERLSDETTQAAAAAGCSPLEEPAEDASGGTHLQAGQTFDYPDRPATAGPHNLSWLEESARVLNQPVDETQAVHTLEHGSVIAYYRPPGEGGVTQDVVDGLATLAPTLRATYLIPYASFEEGVGFSVVAWNKRITCPGTVTADQARVLVQGFEQAYACTSNAPEGNLGDGC